MKNKKLALTMASLGALAVVAVGGTFAFFTSQSSVSNTFTIGSLDTEISESYNPDLSEDETYDDRAVKNEDGELIRSESGGIRYENVFPGDTLSKIAVMTNTGNSTEWVRVSVDVTDSEGKLTDDQKAELKADIINDMVTNYGWATKSGDDYIYYTSALQAGEEAKLFDKIHIPGTWDNAIQDASFDIELKGQAVQFDNNGDGAGETYEDADWNGVE